MPMEVRCIRPLTHISHPPQGSISFLRRSHALQMKLTLVALGPLTNVAQAIRKDAAKMQRLQRIVVMGGAFEDYGNVTTTAEFNIFVDPHAAQEVFDADIPIDIAPLDATHQVVLTGERLHAEVDHRSRQNFPIS